MQSTSWRPINQPPDQPELSWHQCPGQRSNHFPSTRRPSSLRSYVLPPVGVQSPSFDNRTNVIPTTDTLPTIARPEAAHKSQPGSLPLPTATTRVHRASTGPRKYQPGKSIRIAGNIGRGPPSPAQEQCQTNNSHSDRSIDTSGLAGGTDISACVYHSGRIADVTPLDYNRPNTPDDVASGSRYSDCGNSRKDSLIPVREQHDAHGAVDTSVSTSHGHLANDQNDVARSGEKNHDWAALLADEMNKLRENNDRIINDIKEENARRDRALLADIHMLVTQVSKDTISSQVDQLASHQARVSHKQIRDCFERLDAREIDRFKAMQQSRDFSDHAIRCRLGELDAVVRHAQEETRILLHRTPNVASTTPTSHAQIASKESIALDHIENRLEYNQRANVTAYEAAAKALDRLQEGQRDLERQFQTSHDATCNRLEAFKIEQLLESQQDLQQQISGTHDSIDSRLTSIETGQRDLKAQLVTAYGLTDDRFDKLKVKHEDLERQFEIAHHSTSDLITMYRDEQREMNARFTAAYKATDHRLGTIQFEQQDMKRHMITSQDTVDDRLGSLPLEHQRLQSQMLAVHEMLQALSTQQQDLRMQMTSTHATLIEHLDAVPAQQDTLKSHVMIAHDSITDDLSDLKTEQHDLRSGLAKAHSLMGDCIHLLHVHQQTFSTQKTGLVERFSGKTVYQDFGTQWEALSRGDVLAQGCNLECTASDPQCAVQIADSDGSQTISYIEIGVQIDDTESKPLGSDELGNANQHSQNMAYLESDIHFVCDERLAKEVFAEHRDDNHAVAYEAAPSTTKTNIGSHEDDVLGPTFDADIITVATFPEPIQANDPVNVHNVIGPDFREKIRLRRRLRRQRQRRQHAEELATVQVAYAQRIGVYKEVNGKEGTKTRPRKRKRSAKDSSHHAC